MKFFAILNFKYLINLVFQYACVCVFCLANGIKKNFDSRLLFVRVSLTRAPRQKAHYASGQSDYNEITIVKQYTNDLKSECVLVTINGLLWMQL